MPNPYNPWSYIDQGQVGGGQPAYNQVWPQDTQENIWSSAYRDLEPEDIGNAWKALGGIPTSYEVPNFTNVGQQITGWGADPEEKKALARQMTDAMTGALSNDTGMIRMGGKEFPNAYLHRAIGDPKELDWWEKLFQRGGSSQKPTSAVTPSVLQTYQSEPYGLMINVNEPSQLKHAAATDVWSEGTMRPGTDYLDIMNPLLRNFWRARDKAVQRSRDLMSSRTLNSDPAVRKTLIDDAGKIKKEIYEDTIQRVEEIARKKAPGSEIWEPTSGNEYWLDPATQGLDELFASQLRGLNRSGDPSSLHLQHSELIPEINRSMVAGVRLPLWFDENNDSAEQALLYLKLRSFADQMNVPVFRFPAVMTREQQRRGLEEPFAGKWGRKPGGDYITSSMLPKIFGITELP